MSWRRKPKPEPEGYYRVEVVKPSGYKEFWGNMAPTASWNIKLKTEFTCDARHEVDRHAEGTWEIKLIWVPNTPQMAIDATVQVDFDDDTDHPYYQGGY